MSVSSRGLSAVISALLLSAVVIAVGGAVWSFSQGATTLVAEDYVEEIKTLTEVISERFIIEHVSHDGVSLSVWVYNYGDVDIEVKVKVGDFTFPEDWIEVASKDMVLVPPEDLTATPGDELEIKAYSGRGNNAYYRYLVPPP